jgi:hypothetical protein
MVERREALRPTSLGARGWRYQLRKAGPLLRLKGASQASWRLPPLHRLAWVREGLANLGRFAPRERSNMSVIPGRRDRTAQCAARSRRTRNLDVIEHNISGFRVRA